MAISFSVSDVFVVVDGRRKHAAPFVPIERVSIEFLNLDVRQLYWAMDVPLTIWLEFWLPKIWLLGYTGPLGVTFEGSQLPFAKFYQLFGQCPWNGSEWLGVGRRLPRKTGTGILCSGTYSMRSVLLMGLGGAKVFSAGGSVPLKTGSWKFEAVDNGGNAQVASKEHCETIAGFTIGDIGWRGWCWFVATFSESVCCIADGWRLLCTVELVTL